MFSGLPQTADIGVACRKEIPLAAPVEPPSNFRVGASLDPAVRSPGSAAGTGAAPTSRRAALAAATTRHRFRPSACHLPDYARRRFRSSGWLSHHVDGRSSVPQRVPFGGDPPLGLLSQVDLTEGKHAADRCIRPRHFRPLVIPRHRRRASFAGIWFQRRGIDPGGCDGVMDRAKRKIGGSRVATRCRGWVRLPRSRSKVSLYRLAVCKRLVLKERLPRQKIADSQPIDQNYCCTVCIVVISRERI